MAKIPDSLQDTLSFKDGILPAHIRPKRSDHPKKNNGYNSFMEPLQGPRFFNRRFQAYGNKASDYNRVTGAFMNQAMFGNNPNTLISYPYLQIPRGTLPGAENASATLNKDGNILFSWTDNSNTGSAKANDKVILVAYFPKKKQIIFTRHAARRAGCQALLQTNKMQGLAAETWIVYISHDEQDAADSVYAGSIQL